MRKLIFAFMLLACWARASTPNVTFTFADFTTTAQKVRLFNLYPLGANTNGNTLITQDRVTVVVGTNGSVTVSNVVPGDYRGEFVGTTITTTNCFTIPDVSGTINAISNLAASGCASLNAPGASGGYTKNQANGRFLQSTNTGAAGYVFNWLSSSNIGYWAATTGGSGGTATNLTPWTSDINAANFGLTNASKVVSTNLAGNGANISNVVGVLTLSNSVFVMKGGSDATGTRNRADKPFSTLAAAQAASVAGDMIIVYPGSYTGKDLGSNNVNWYFYPGTYLTYDGTGLSGGIFTDNPTTWSGTFSDGTNSKTFNIYGHVTATNLADGFLKIGGAHSRIVMQYDALRGASQNSRVIVALFNSYDFGGLQGPIDMVLNISGADTEGTVYLSESSGTIDLGYFTNGLIYLDRDTTDPVGDLLIRAREARKCAVFGARPSGSKTVFDIPLWVGSPPFLAQGTYNMSGLGYFHSGEMEFRGTTFIQATNITSTNLFYCEWGSAYATPDYTNQVKLTFNNCRMIGRAGGGTNQLIRFSTATSTNAPTMCVLGGLEVANFMVSGLPRQECAGSIVQNPMLANLSAPIGASVKGNYTNWIGTNLYKVTSDSSGTHTFYDARPDSGLPQQGGLFSLSSALDGAGTASVYGFYFVGDAGGLTNILPSSIAIGTIGAGVYASNIVSGGQIPTAALPIIPPNKLGGTNGHADGEAWVLDHGTNKLASVSGSGTVTSVGVSVPAGLSVSGTPVTSSGTIAISAAAAVLTNGATGYFSSVNVTGTGPTVIYGDNNQTNALVVSANGAFLTNALGQIVLRNGNQTNSGNFVSTNGVFLGNGSGLTNIPYAGLTAPGAFLTNGYTGSVSFNNASNNFLGLIQVSQETYPTNSGNNLTPNFGFVAAYLSTNAAFTVAAPTAVNPNNFETFVYFVTNTTASAVNISTTGIAANNKIGTFNVTNMSVLTFTHWGYVWTNVVCTPLF